MSKRAAEMVEEHLCPSCGWNAKLVACSKEDNKTKICAQCYFEEENILFFMRSLYNKLKENKRRWNPHVVRY